MSPNEAQLRSALHEGEGDTVDAGALMARAVGVRRARRRRVYLVAGAAAAVAVVGVGIAALTNTPGHNNSAAGARADTAMKPAHRPAQLPHAGAATPPPVPTATQGTSAASGYQMEKRSAPAGCPQTASRYLLPAGGGSGQSGVSGRLFTHSVDKIVVCGYPAKASQKVRRVIVRRGAAMAASLESAPTTYGANPSCPLAERAVSGKLELLASSANGTRSKPVLITVGCPRTTATNGTAVRYPDSLPHRFLNLLRTNITASPVK